MRKKTAAGIFRFGSMPFFNTRKAYEEKNRGRYFEIHKYAFLKYLKKV